MSKKNKKTNILLTGGTGSLGTALVEKLLNSDYHYNKIIVYSRSEHLQEQLHHKISAKYNTDRVRYLLGDVRDAKRLRMAIAGNNIETIINAAALKIVPKGEYDPIEFIKTNVNGVQNVIEAAIDHDVKKVVQVSTDKAVAPVNLYGATKLCAEKLVIAANNIRGEGGPIFGFVRYGNVSGSNGSVIPLFMKQYHNDMPFTITDKRMTRFWITLQDAAEFVLKSSRYMTRNKNIFIPTMKAYNIVELARAIAPQGDAYPIRYVGIRPGEKLHENILTQEERLKFPDIPFSSDVAEQLTCEKLSSLLEEYAIPF